METSIIPGESGGAIQLAAEILAEGGLVAFPTDTVYGLGADAWNSQAIERLFDVKGRDISKAIAVLVGSVEEAELVAGEMNEIARKLAKRFWPGPLTLVVEAHAGLAENLSPTPTVGVRMPDHPVALELLKKSGPLAVTSANLSGKPNSGSAEEVYGQLGGRISLILDGGRSPGGEPSTVVDCNGGEPVILRQGPIRLEQLLEAIG